VLSFAAWARGLWSKLRIRVFCVAVADVSRSRACLGIDEGGALELRRGNLMFRSCSGQ
jgi:hypothetical protein